MPSNAILLFIYGIIIRTLQLIMAARESLPGCMMYSVAQTIPRKVYLVYNGASLYECAAICQGYNWCKAFTLHPETETCSLCKVKAEMGMQNETNGNVDGLLYTERALMHKTIIGGCQRKQCNAPQRCQVSRQGVGFCTGELITSRNTTTQKGASGGSVSKQRVSKKPLGMPNCPRKQGFNLNQKLKFCYKLSSNWMSRDSSRRRCKQEGGRLARLNTAEKMAAAVTIVRQAHFGEMYVDGTLESGKWWYQDSKPIANIKWAVGEPRPEFFYLCLSVKADGLHKVDCMSLRAFVCELALEDVLE